MKIRIIGSVLTALFFILIAYILANIDAGVAFGTVTPPSRLIDLTTGLIPLIYGLSEMLWHSRAIDMIVQAAFLFSAALASSVFFREGRAKGETPKSEESESKEE